MALHDTLTQLERARSLELPARDLTLRRDPSVATFWADNREVLTGAWAEWEAGYREGAATGLDESLIDAALHDAVSGAWADPTSENAVADLIREAAPGVYSFQFFEPDRLVHLRTYLEAVWDSGIPLRPPYGIVLNRRGAMLDPRSVGSLAAPGFQEFYRLVMDSYMRPIARLLFPEIMGHDSQTFGFSINYQPDTDTSIRPHTDASAVTLNINVNLPGEEFTGSTVDFLDPASEQVTSLTFEPGTAMIHRGTIPHTAHPITSGQRTNLVLWLFGERGSIPGQRSEAPAPDATARWTVPDAKQDAYVPF